MLAAALVVVTGGMALSGQFPEAEAASHEMTYKSTDYELNRYVKDGDSWTPYEDQYCPATLFYVDGEAAYCIEMYKGHAAGSASVADIGDYLSTKEQVIAALAQQYIMNETNYTKTEKQLLTNAFIWNMQLPNWRISIETIDGFGRRAQWEFFDGLYDQMEKVWKDYEAECVAYKNVDVGDKQAMGVLGVPKLKTGEVQLKKAFANTSITEGNSCYSLKGAEYRVYEDSACTKQVGTLTTDASGNSNTLTVTIGTYYVKEYAASPGYALDEHVYSVTVKSGSTATVSVKEEPLNDPGMIELIKLDAETGESSPMGAASLAGAQFTVKFYAGYYTEETLPETATRTWVIETKEEKESTEENIIRYLTRLDEKYRVDGDELYYYNGAATFPLGTISVEETKAPEGYLLEGAYLQPKENEERSTKKVEGLYVTQIRQDDEVAELIGGNVYSMSDSIKRGDFEFVKIEGKSHKRMANIPFRVTSKTTGESHILVTDENGEASTASSNVPHSQNTNGNDAVEDGSYDSAAGIWFGQASNGESVAVNDELGALPYDTYTVEELSCAANEGHELVPAFEVVISRDKKTVKLGTITNETVPVPEISMQTTAVGQEDGTKVLQPEEEVTIVDTVSIKGLQVGHTYRLSGWQMLKDSNAELLVDGKRVENAVEFQADAEEMQVEVSYTFNAENLGGSDLVTFEELYDLTDSEEGKLVAEHKSIEDKDQTVKVKEKEKKTETKTFTPKASAPKTGDTAKVWLWVALAVAAVAVGISSIIRQKKRRKKGVPEGLPEKPEIAEKDREN